MESQCFHGPSKFAVGQCNKILSLESIVLYDKSIMSILTSRYIVRGARGDFNLPGAVWQGLHADVWREWLIDTAPTQYSDSGHLNYRDLPVFYVVVNFNVINITALNAPIRQIPMTQHSQQVMLCIEFVCVVV